MKPGDYQPLPPEAHDYLDGRLALQDEEAFSRRLERDDDLRSRINELRTAREWLGNLADVAPPANFDQRVKERIRDSGLADKARARIQRTRTPVWTYVAQIGAGAVAASLVFALMGWPLSGDDTEPVLPDGTSVAPTAVASVEEQDILPALSDQATRLETLSQCVQAVSARETDIQRELIRTEIDASELVARSVRLRGLVAGLPAQQRVNYEAFLDAIVDAVQTVDQELVDSRVQNRALSLGRVQTALSGVSVPENLRDRSVFVIVRASSSDASHAVRVSESGPELTRYASLRSMQHQHDYEGILASSDDYLRWFPNGRFASEIKAAKVLALLRLNRDQEAVDEYLRLFPNLRGNLLSENDANVTKALIRDNERIRLDHAIREHFDG